MSSGYWDLWEEITNKFVLNDNFASLREILKEIQPPLIPYLGMYVLSLFLRKIILTCDNN